MAALEYWIEFHGEDPMTRERRIENLPKYTKKNANLCWVLTSGGKLKRTRKNYTSIQMPEQHRRR